MLKLKLLELHSVQFREPKDIFIKIDYINKDCLLYIIFL